MTLSRMLVALAGGVVVAAEPVPAAGQGGFRGGPRVQIVAPAAVRGEVAATVGTPLRLRAQLATGGNLRPIEDQVTWTSSDSTVLVIGNGRDGTPAGHAMPLRPGVVGVTATYPRLDGAPSPDLPTPVGDSILVVIADASPRAATTSTVVEADAVDPAAAAE